MRVLSQSYTEAAPKFAIEPFPLLHRCDPCNDALEKEFILMNETSSMSHTILIPTKDRPILLQRAVKSALGALDEDGEILVVDDDSTPSAAESLVDFDDPRIRIVLNSDATGVSAVRNFGMFQARGRIVFFLDDDDEIQRGYCLRILKVVRTSTPSPDYGFSAYDTVSDNAEDTACSAPSAGKIRLPNGIIADTECLKKRTFGFGMGFWVKREVFYDIGEFDEDISINEDTEYSCRLITRRKIGWYSDKPGVLLHSHSTPDELAHLTHRTGPSERARCFLHVYQKYPNMCAHLGVGYLKYTVKSGHFRTAWKFVRSQTRIGLRVRFYALVITK